ncbi:MAG: tripartite tricarboxylate transporter substrate binding protein [Betaproteobacteria bacterium]|nr:tripartite tricarboxylate transporter substrate binding protein [Betaproteobacteria bacterium]
MKRLEMVFFAAVLALAGCTALAQAWPSRPIKLVIPFPPGGNTDASARVVAQALQERLDQAVVPENKPGAASRIAMESVAKSAPDGYTLMYATTTFATNTALFGESGLPFNVQRDFAPIAHVAYYPYTVMVRSSLGVNSLQDLVARAKHNPGKIVAGTLLGGTMPNLALELFKRRMGVDLLAIPYKGTGPALTDLIAERIDVYFEGRIVAEGHIKAGKVKVLALAWPVRSLNSPDLPTFGEAGYPGFEATAWFGVAAPAGTPPEVIARLNREIVSAVKDPAIHQRLVQMDLIPTGTSPEEFGRIIRDDTAKWAQVIREAGIKPE